MHPAPHRSSWLDRVVRAVRSRLGRRRRALPWRLAAPTVFLLAGLLFITSAVSSQGTDLRAGGFQDLDGLANNQRDGVERLRSQASGLEKEVDRLTTEASAGTPPELKARIASLRKTAGLEPVHGPGVTITLTDAPPEVQDSVDTSVVDVTDLLVHQQDIQAVANALWAGGAEAMTIQGQRVVATTGIKCVGNSVVLHDVPYAPPYKISAIGPTAQMLDSINETPYIALYLKVVDAYDLGWDVQLEDDLQMPGFSGSTTLRYAKAAGPAAPSGGATE